MSIGIVPTSGKMFIAEARTQLHLRLEAGGFSLGRCVASIPKQDAALAAELVRRWNGYEPGGEVEKLREALKGIMAEMWGNPKSCGHDFPCICAGEAARAVLAKGESS